MALSRDELVDRLERLAHEVDAEQNPFTAAVLLGIAGTVSLNRTREMAIHLKPFLEENWRIIQRLKAERN